MAGAAQLRDTCHLQLLDSTSCTEPSVTTQMTHISNQIAGRLYECHSSGYKLKIPSAISTVSCVQTLSLLSDTNSRDVTKP
jgi:hypothetical protein